MASMLVKRFQSSIAHRRAHDREIAPFLEIAAKFLRSLDPEAADDFRGAIIEYEKQLEISDAFQDWRNLREAESNLRKYIWGCMCLQAKNWEPAIPITRQSLADFFASGLCRDELLRQSSNYMTAPA